MVKAYKITSSLDDLIPFLCNSQYRLPGTKRECFLNWTSIMNSRESPE
jgi:hypothetical protein